MSNQPDPNSNNPAERLAAKIQAMLNGPATPPEIVAVMERDNRGTLTDVATNYQIFLEEIQESKSMLLPTIGYVGNAMNAVSRTMIQLLDPTTDQCLHEMAAPCIVGYEEVGAEAFSNMMGIEFLDLTMMACIAAAKGMLVARIRKFCGIADMLSKCKEGEGAGPDFTVAMMESMVRIIRLMDKIGITFTEKEQARFDLADASVKLQAYIKRETEWLKSRGKTEG